MDRSTLPHPFRKIPLRLSLWVFLPALLCVGIYGLLWTLTDGSNYPGSIEVTTFGRCDTRDWYRYQTTIRVTYYGCWETEDSASSVGVWYLRNGYAQQNDGWVKQSRQDLGIETIVVERIYTLSDGEEDGTVIRVYRDTTWRFPQPFSFISP